MCNIQYKKEYSSNRTSTGPLWNNLRLISSTTLLIFHLLLNLISLSLSSLSLPLSLSYINHKLTSSVSAKSKEKKWVV